MTALSVLQTARSLLFVPGNRPERFAKAGASGASVVCIDLEDAVPPQARAKARSDLLAFLALQDRAHKYGVRFNRLQSADGLRDLLAFVERASVRPAFVMLAKTESASDVQLLAAHLPGVPLIALIESPRGLDAAMPIAHAHPQLQALMLGGVDLCVELGCDFAWEPLLFARSRLVAAAASAGLLAIDVPWLDVADGEGARTESARAASLGFAAKALIHPSQVAPVHSGLAPAPEALARAQRIVTAAGTDDAAVLLDGRLIDRPVVLAAAQLLRRAGL
jgi:(S)-citramalyl-CoA lyase